MPLKYDFATYRDNNGILQKIFATSLKSMSIGERVKTRELELYDEEEEEHRIFPRFTNDTPHFYCRGADRSEFDKNQKDKCAKHDQRIIELVNNLKMQKKWNIGYYCGDNTKDKIWETLITIENYSWESEVTRIIDSGYRTRHDIFGAYMDLKMSYRTPFVAIEVVKSHFPEKETFEKLLNISKFVPMIIVFDFTSKKNYFLELKEGKIRISSYIYNGKLWDRDMETEVYTQEYAYEYFKKKKYLEE